jgi:hypothetical protein
MPFATIVPQDAAEIKRSVRELAKTGIRLLTGVSPASTLTAQPIVVGRELGVLVEAS